MDFFHIIVESDVFPFEKRNSTIMRIFLTLQKIDNTTCTFGVIIFFFCLVNIPSPFLGFLLSGTVLGQTRN